jgi:hypothetical protein
MAKRLEPLYIACCPFCDYRHMFGSQVSLMVCYGAHLHRHEVALLRPSGRPGGGGGDISDARIAEHAKRIQAAAFN